MSTPLTTAPTPMELVQTVNQLVQESGNQQQNLTSHMGQQEIHLTQAERENWNSRATAQQGQKADAALPRTGGSLEGTTIAQNNADYGVFQLRNLAMGTEIPSQMENGQIFFQY